jgi:MoxR-like ATPase
MIDSVSLIGRKPELQKIRACLKAHRNLLLEGPVGVGKTRLALTAAKELGRPVFRIDGDGRYTEQKLTGWFDPPLVLQKGYTAESFIPGPLTQAMREGGVLLLNELNRLPEGVQNVLLPAIDERFVQIPHLGRIDARPEFVVMATQNPKEFVATSHLSEALLDRFELLALDYQTEEEEKNIVAKNFEDGSDDVIEFAVGVVRWTRNDFRVRRGASVRAAISIAEVAHALQGKDREVSHENLIAAALMALPNRIELEREARTEQTPAEQMESVIRDLSAKALRREKPASLKKKPN